MCMQYMDTQIKLAENYDELHTYETQIDWHKPWHSTSPHVMQTIIFTVKNSFSNQNKNNLHIIVYMH